MRNLFSILATAIHGIVKIMFLDSKFHKYSPIVKYNYLSKLLFQILNLSHLIYVDFQFSIVKFQLDFGRLLFITPNI